MRGFRNRAAVFAALLLTGALAGPARAGDAPAAPLGEIQALERAIARELNTGHLGSHTLGELQRLLHRLKTARGDSGETERRTALSPLSEGGEATELRRLEEQAAAGDRTALRALALYRLYRNNPEQAMLAWRQMGSANANDVPFHLLSAYLEMALGEYNSARASLATAARLIETRGGLELSPPLFCTNIAGYRLYETRRAGDFLPGEDTLVYVEIDGADFRTLPSGDSECGLVFGMTLRNASDAIVWAEPNYGAYAPVFNGPIRDLHTALAWRVPNDLPSGLYRLRIEAVEEGSRRRGECSVEFNLAARPTNPPEKPGAAYPPGFNDAIRDAQRQFPGSAPVFRPEAPSAAPGMPPGMSEEWLRNEGYQDLIRKRTQYE